MEKRAGSNYIGSDDEGPRTFKVGDEYAQLTQVDRQTFCIAFHKLFCPCLDLSASEYMAFRDYFAQPAHWMKQCLVKIPSIFELRLR